MIGPEELGLDRFFTDLFEAVSPRETLARAVKWDGPRLCIGERQYDLGGVGSVAVLGLGKAGAAQAAECLKCLRAGPSGGPRLGRSLVLTKEGHAQGLSGIKGCEILEGNHPVCGPASLKAGEALGHFLETLPLDGFLIVCLSGGFSTIAVLPLEMFTLEDKIQVNEAMLKAGLSIGKMNSIRREMSRVKNGGLVHMSRANRIACMITSDVPGPALSDVGSGPTYFEPADDPKSRADLVEIASAVIPGDLKDRFIAHIGSDIRQAIAKRRLGSFKHKDIYNVCVGDSDLLLSQAKAILEKDGWAVESLGTMSGPIDDGIARHLTALEALKAKGARRGCLISGGELTFNVTGDGMGGRNTEFALRTARRIFPSAGLKICITAIGTDGSDGPTSYAGAWADQTSYQAALAKGLDPAAFQSRNDSMHFFEKAGTLIRTGPTGTNLMDLRVIQIFE